MKKIHRYPGIRPFSEEYQSVFYGRSTDIEGIEKMLKVNNLVVVYGKSGLGKSSLLNAGLIPKIDTEQEFQTIFIRFGSYNPQYPRSLKELFIERIKEYLSAPDQVFFSELKLPHWEIAIWQWMKTLISQTMREDGVILVLDQFEEVFTYPDNEVESFISEFSELINDRMPESFRTALYDSCENEDDFLEKNQGEINLIDGEKTIKTIIGIRSDKLSLLDRFSDHIPNILKNNYGLKALNWEQAKEAITAPAIKPDDDKVSFVSPRFTINEDFLVEVLDFLSRHGTRPVETFLLQIVCQHIEDWVTLNYDLDSENIEVSKSDIQNLSEVVREYYINVVKGTNIKTKEATASAHDQLLTRYLIEHALIDKMHNNRISLDMALVKQNGLYDELIDRLIDARIIRQEPNTVSGISYELSHDTLIDPVLNSEASLGDLEERVNDFYREHVSLTEQAFIEKYFLTKERKLRRVDHSEIEKDNDLLSQLEEAKILRDFSPPQEDTSKYEIYPMFHGAVLKYRAELENIKLNRETTKRKKASYAATTAIVLLLISVSSMLFAINKADKAKKAEVEMKAALQNAEEARLRTVQARDSLDSEREKAIESKVKADSLRIISDSLKIIADGKAREISLYARQVSVLNSQLKASINEVSTNLMNTQGFNNQLEAEKAKTQKELEESRNIELFNKLFTLAQKTMASNPTKALRLAEYCMETGIDNSRSQKLVYQIIGNSQNSFYSHNLIGHTNPILGLDVSKNGQVIVTSSGGKNPEIMTWNLVNKTNKRFSFFHKNDINTIKFINKDQRIISGSTDNQIASWTPQGVRVSSTDMGSTVVDLDYSELSKRLYVAKRQSGSLPAQIITLENNFKDRYTKNSKTGVLGLDISINDQFFITGGNSGTVSLWDIERRKPTQTFIGCKTGLRDVRFSPRGDMILGSCGVAYTAVLWKLDNAEPLLQFNGSGVGTAVEFGTGNDPQSVFIATDRGRIQEVSIQGDNDVIRVFTGHEEVINNIKKSEAGNFIVSVSDDKTVRIWPLITSEIRNQIVESYQKNKELDEVMPLIQRFLLSEEVAELTDQEKLELGIKL